MKNAIQIIILGVIISSIGLFFGYRSYSFTQNTIPTTGTIVSYIDSIDECFLVVDFKTDEGEPVTFINRNIELNRESSDWKTKERIPFGNAYDGCYLQTILTADDGTVPVLYKRSDPKQAVIKDFISVRILSFSFFFIGLLTCLAGLQIGRGSQTLYHGDK